MFLPSDKLKLDSVTGDLLIGLHHDSITGVSKQHVHLWERKKFI